MEVLESRYPAVRVERFALRTDGVGPGLHRGGMGVVREYRILEDGILMQTVTENTRDQLGKGVGGGGIGGQPAIVIGPDSEDELRQADGDPLRPTRGRRSIACWPRRRRLERSATAGPKQVARDVATNSRTQRGP